MSYNPEKLVCTSCGRMGVSRESCPGKGSDCGTCNRCRSKGHTSKTCSATITCSLCRQKGHTRLSCPKSGVDNPLNYTSSPAKSSSSSWTNVPRTTKATAPEQPEQYEQPEHESENASYKSPLARKAAVMPLRKWFSLNVEVVSPKLELGVGSLKVSLLYITE